MDSTCPVSPEQLTKKPFLTGILLMDLLSSSPFRRKCGRRSPTFKYLNYKLTDIETMNNEIIFLAVIMITVMDIMSKISKIEQQN